MLARLSQGHASTGHPAERSGETVHRTGKQGLTGSMSMRGELGRESCCCSNVAKLMCVVY